jgi:excinuclease ABC subunit A
MCEGRGIVTVAMQFLADVETVCEECNGQRFRPEVLEVRYRDRSVFDILNMTADEAFTFFNGHHRIQQRLNAIRQTGLGYLRLGQPLSTISGGEAQRLRIAAMLAGIPLADGEVAADNRKAAQLARSGRTLFLLDEPSVGLHMQDIERLVGCIDFLLQTGHSVVVIDHDQTLISQADWEIELGPGPGKQGGQIVRSGPQA